LKHSRARQIKWDIVDHLLCSYIESEVVANDYTQEERDYAIDQIRRIAKMLNVTDHIYLNN
jgi:hypothetical protein